jgi:hypothetical protein
MNLKDKKYVKNTTQNGLNTGQTHLNVVYSVVAMRLSSFDVVYYHTNVALRLTVDADFSAIGTKVW